MEESVRRTLIYNEQVYPYQYLIVSQWPRPYSKYKKILHDNQDVSLRIKQIIIL